MGRTRRSHQEVIVGKERLLARTERRLSPSSQGAGEARPFVHRVAHGHRRLMLHPYSFPAGPFPQSD